MATGALYIHGRRRRRERCARSEGELVPSSLTAKLAAHHSHHSHSTLRLRLRLRLGRSLTARAASRCHRTGRAGCATCRCAACDWLWETRQADDTHAVAVLLLWKRAGSERRGWLEQTRNETARQTEDSGLWRASGEGGRGQIPHGGQLVDCFARCVPQRNVFLHRERNPLWRRRQRHDCKHNSGWMCSVQPLSSVTSAMHAADYSPSPTNLTRQRDKSRPRRIVSIPRASHRCATHSIHSLASLRSHGSA